MIIYRQRMMSSLHTDILQQGGIVSSLELIRNFWNTLYFRLVKTWRLSLQVPSAKNASCSRTTRSQECRAVSDELRDDIHHSSVVLHVSKIPAMDG